MRQHTQESGAAREQILKPIELAFAIKKWDSDRLAM
jgi:hypothetical protein